MSASQPSRMNGSPASRLRLSLALLWLLSVVWNDPLIAHGLGRESASATNRVRVVAIQGTNWWIAPSGAADWVLASTRMPQDIHAGDRLRTGRNTRLFLQTPQLGVMQVPPFSTIEIAAPPQEGRSMWVRIVSGMLYFFHRGSPTDVEVHTRSASAAIRGTEFVAEALEDGGLTIRVVDGTVTLSNDQGSVTLQKGDDGVANAGRQPSRTPRVYSLGAIQWCLYYPAVIDPDELPFTGEERAILSASLRSYRSGDLNSALEQYPDRRDPQSAQERVYLAALWLAMGRVDESATLLKDLTAANSTALPGRLSGALQLMQAATRSEPRPMTSAPLPTLTSEWMAGSYFLQSQGQLNQAREAAREATRRSPAFGFAWARLAELEFSFGRTAEAAEALQKAVELSPRNAEAIALQGFQSCALNDIPAALEAFERSLILDPGLGNAWLGRGLCRIRQGHIHEGLEDLEVAAAVEPQRALLRSYLGKAFAADGNTERARKEFDLAKSLDRNDPTAWLYAAILDQQGGRINEGIRNLERSKQLNQERGLYRSRHLLDQDRAVRGANLSALYRDAGFLDLGRREAVDAVNTDYANYSAHLLLANTYSELRDPGQVDLRYETPWLNEYLLANLLSPVGAGTLSQTVSAQEFSRLFERDGIGLSSVTEYGSNGDWIQSAAQYGILGNLSYTLEADYRSNAGQRPNNDLEQRTFSLKAKQQLGPADSVYLESVYYEAKGGDLGRVYDPLNAALFRSRYRFEESQEPLLFAGYHHEWSPGQHTLFSAGRLQDQLNVSDPAQPVLLVSRDPAGAVTGTLLTSADQHYRSEAELFSVELQHIAQFESWTFITGTRSQHGDFATGNRQENLADLTAALPAPLQQQFDPSLQRWTAYGYAQCQVADPLWLFGGLSYDHLRSPSDYRFAPLLNGEETREQWSPKAGFLWKLTAASNLRGAYTRSLGGVSFDQSYRLEPSQIAGLNQVWRSFIPESVVGSQAGAHLEMGSLEWDHRFPTETYVSVRGDIGKSRVSRRVGVFELPFLAEPSSTLESLRYEETSLTVTANQLVGRMAALGAAYHLTRSRLQDEYPGIPGSVPHLFPPYQLKPLQSLEGTLHQLLLFASVNHESGAFGRIESILSSQSNEGYEPMLPPHAFVQFNLWAGYRLPNRRAELRLGLLNLTDQDYRLNPLNLTPELPRHRTFVASLRFNF